MKARRSTTPAAKRRTAIALALAFAAGAAGAKTLVYCSEGSPENFYPGINTTGTMILTYVLCSSIVAFAAVLLTARVATGEATLGATLLLESITAVVIGGVSFFGGIGRLSHVILGALFVTMMTNGMNLLRVESYVQQIVLGALLITAVVVDQIRVRLLRQQHVE